MRTACKLSALLTVLLAVCADGQAQRPVPNWEGIQFRGFLDGCWTYNANHPDRSAGGGRNVLYNFNDEANQFNPTMAELGFSYQHRFIGATATLLFGRANTLIHDASSRPTSNYVEQAFLSLKPAHSHGAQLDFGQFVTSAGAETIEAQNDWNYSRSLLFSYAIPYYHFGMRATFPVNNAWTAGFQVVNGWNTVAADNRGLTVGLTSALTRPKYGWDANCYSGPIEVNGQAAYRDLIDSTLSLSPTSRFSAYLNYDYGQNRFSSRISAPERSPHWQGIAVAAREQLPIQSAVAVRYEYFDDHGGFATGKAQLLHEVTATYVHKWREGLESRLEYRRDWSDEEFFPRGTTGMVRAQSTAAVALIACFGCGS